MLIGRNLLPEDRKLRVAVGPLDVAKFLVVGSVLFDDVDDVLDLRRNAYSLRNDRRSQRRASLGEQRIIVRCVLDDLTGPMRQILLDVGQRQRLQATLLDRLDGLVAVPLGSQRAARPLSVRMPFLALAVPDIESIAMVGDSQGRGIPARRNESANGAVFP